MLLAVLGPALIGAGAALAGVTLGAVLEPLKLRFAHRARVQQERLSQCARLIEAATDVNALWNHLRTVPASVWDAKLPPLELQRATLNKAERLLAMYGPDELASAARAVAAADYERRLQFRQTTHDDSLALELATTMADAIDAFVDVAQKCTR